MEHYPPVEDPGTRSPADPPQPAAHPTFGERALVAFLRVLALVYAGVTAFAAWWFWLAWHTAANQAWQRLMTALVTMFFVASAFAATTILGPTLVRLRVLVRQLRAENDRGQQAAITGDDQLAPLANQQPEPLPVSEIPIGTVEFGPFGSWQRRRTRPAIAQPLVVVVIASGVIAAVVVVPGLVPFGGEFPSLPLANGFAILTVGLAALIGIASVARIVLSIWMLVHAGGDRIPHFAADDRGMRQVGGRRAQRRSIAWHEIRAFYRAEDRPRLKGGLVTPGPAQQTTYTVDTGDRQLRWSIWEDSTSAQRADSERLCCLVVTRTRLPLRDLTAVASRQAMAVMELIAPFAGPLLGRRFVSQEPTASPRPWPAAPAFRPLGNPRTRRLVVIGIALAIFSTLLLGVGMIGPIIQSTLTTP